MSVSWSRLEILTSCLGLVSAGEVNVLFSGGERLGLELLRFVPIPVIITITAVILNCNYCNYYYNYEVCSMYCNVILALLAINLYVKEC